MKHWLRPMTALLAAGLLLMGWPLPARAATPATAEIRPELELLSGVLAQTSWVGKHGPDGSGSAYYRALKSYLAPYKDHPAVQMAERLTQGGFSYDAPVAFMLHLGPLPDLDLRYEYSDYLVKRADREQLEQFRLALKDLAAQSHFDQFIAEWQPQYDQWVKVDGFDANKVTNWLTDFYGGDSREFHFVLAPAMFPGGGYGATVSGPNGQKIVYQVIRDNGTSATVPVFPNGPSLERLAAHEWGHSYVNPAVEANAAQVQSLAYLYRPVQQSMQKQAYGQLGIFMNEQVLRAATVLAVEDWRGPAAAEAEIHYNYQRGFYLTRPMVAALREYQQNRQQYPDFQSFVPVLLDRVKNEPFPTNYHPVGNYPTWYRAAGAGLLILGAGLSRYLWRRRRDEKYGRRTTV